MATNDLLNQAYTAWAKGGDPALSALVAAAQTQSLNLQELQAQAVALEAVSKRCIVSKIKARFIRSLLAAQT